MRLDGSRIDFSYRKCVYPPTDMQDFVSACRQAVAVDLLTYKQEAWQEGMSCPFTGETLSWNTVDVDHMPPYTFARIVHEFIDYLRIDVSVMDFDHGGIGPTLTDESLVRAWRAFHAERAVYRLIFSPR